MRIAEKLVLQRQRHLKWRALDVLEMILMIICGVLLFGFSTTVMFDIVTRTIGSSLALAAGSHVRPSSSTAIFIGAAVATRRNDHLYLTALCRSAARHAAAGRSRSSSAAWCSGVAVLPDLFRLHQFPARLLAASACRRSRRSPRSMPRFRSPGR